VSAEDAPHLAELRERLGCYEDDEFEDVVDEGGEEGAAVGGGQAARPVSKPSSFEIQAFYGEDGEDI